MRYRQGLKKTSLPLIYYSYNLFPSRPSCPSAQVDSQLCLVQTIFDNPRTHQMRKVESSSSATMEAKFDKIVSKYTRRYDYTAHDFRQFVENKVEMDPRTREKFLRYIESQGHQFTEQTLRKYLHLIGAIQQGLDPYTMDPDYMKKFMSIKFNTSENKKQKPTSQSRQYRVQQPDMSTASPTMSYPPLNTGHFPTKQMEIPDDDEQIDVRKAIKQQDRRKNSQQQRESNLQRNKKHSNRERLNTIQEEKTDEIYKSGESISRSDPLFATFGQPQGTEDANQFGFAYQQVKKPSDNVGRIKYDIVGGQDRDDYDQRQQGEQRKYMQSNEERPDNHRNGHEIAEDRTASNDLITICKFEKMGQDFMNPIIKFQIIYKDKYTTWRRYSQIERLMGYLRSRYQGVVLPEIPPKQGFKGGFNYLWGNTLNQKFLCERQEKLEVMLNRLMKKKDINTDEVLVRFMEDQNFELPNPNVDENYWQTFSGWKDIVLNYSELKDYGLAYYNYISEYKNKPLNTEISKQYEQLQELVNVIMSTNQHRKKINANFDRRREIMFLYEVKTRQPIKTDLDKILEKAEIDCRELATQYANYVQLKSNESWLTELKKQKNTQEGTKSLQKIYNDLEETNKRIKNIEKNLSHSMVEFKQTMEAILQDLGRNMIEWRKKIHP